MCDDRIRQPLVEESGGDHSERIEIVFDQHVEVITGFRFQIRISEGQQVLEISRAAGSREGQGLRDVLRVRSRKPATIDQSKVGTRRESVAQRNAWQHFHVGTVEFVIGDDRRADGSVKDSIYDIEIGAFKSNPADESDSARKIDGVHDVSGGNFLEVAEVGRIDPHRTGRLQMTRDSTSENPARSGS